MLAIIIMTAHAATCIIAKAEAGLQLPSDPDVRGDVSIDLRITAAERGEHAECQELACGDIDPAASDCCPG
jgi:hypothetical protein